MEVIWTIWKAIFYLLLALFISVHMNPHCARTCTVQATTDGAGYIQNYFAERPALKSHILWALTLSETLKIGHFCQIFCKVFINHFFPNYFFTDMFSNPINCHQTKCQNKLLPVNHLSIYQVKWSKYPNLNWANLWFCLRETFLEI